MNFTIAFVTTSAMLLAAGQNELAVMVLLGSGYVAAMTGRRTSR